MADLVIFVAFPYVAVILAVVVSLYRYYGYRFSYSSQSSQFLENRSLFFGSVPWHYGIIIILLAHLLALVLPGQWAALIGDPIRLYILEVTGLALALMVTLAIAWLILRRLRNGRVFAVTTGWDWLLLALLLIQVALGFTVALVYRWGADWYLRTAVPWLVSLVTFSPRIEFVTALPLLAKLHMLNGLLLIAVFPFTRLVHLVTFPVTYLWRPYQVVIWNRRRGLTPALRDSSASSSRTGASRPAAGGTASPGYYQAAVVRSDLSSQQVYLAVALLVVVVAFITFSVWWSTPKLQPQSAPAAGTTTLVYASR